MATRVTEELEHAKHEQDLPEVQRAAEDARRADRRRTEQENEVNRRHEALIEESQHQHFLDNGCAK
jgi:hypothetical protein